MSTRQSRPGTVAVLGGGVAGLSAAHELAERGFRVTVYETSRTTGGKARSIFVPGTGTGGRRDLPGEHGLRFFPSFYRHLPDTMRRIPFGRDPNGVAGNLVATSRTRLARIDGPSFDVLTRFPTGLRDVADAVKLVVRSDVDLPREDLVFVGNLLLTLLTSSRERRFQQYEQVPWWEFVQADRRSAAFRKYFCDVAVRSLVAMCPRQASARTTGVIGAQIWIDHARPGHAGRPAAERPDPRRLAHSLARPPGGPRRPLPVPGPRHPPAPHGTAGSPACGSRRPQGARDVEADHYVAARPGGAHGAPGQRRA